MSCNKNGFFLSCFKNRANFYARVCINKFFLARIVLFELRSVMRAEDGEAFESEDH